MAVTSNLTLIHACNAVTDATTSAVLSSDFGGSIMTLAADDISPREGVGCYGADLDVETGINTITPTASIDLTASVVYCWLKFITADKLDLWANGGVFCTLDDGTNSSTWYLGGSDSVGSAWERLCFSTSTTPDVISGTLTLAAVTTINFGFVGTAKSKLTENVLMDYIHYGADGVGMTVTAGTVGTPETFTDVVGDDETLAVGLLSSSNNIYFMNGPITFGSTAAVDMYFADTDQIIATANRYRIFTTANRGTAESLVSASHYTIEVVGGTGTTSFVLGSKTGALGYSGCVLKTGGDSRLVLTCTETDADIFKLYGCSFINCGAITLPVLSGTDREVVSCNFSGCDQIDPSTCLVTSCIIANTNASTTGAILLDASGSAGLSYLTFISGGTGHGIYIPNGATGSYTFSEFSYSGYGITGSTNAGVYNNSAGLVTITVDGGSSPTYYNGTSASTTLVSSVPITVTVKDQAGTLLTDIQVAIYEGATQLMNEDTVAGVATEAYTGSTPASVEVRVRKSSSGTTKYIPISSNQTIGSLGLTVTITLTEDTNNNA